MNKVVKTEVGKTGDKLRTDTIQETKLIDKMHFQRVEMIRSWHLISG